MCLSGQSYGPQDLGWVVNSRHYAEGQTHPLVTESSTKQWGLSCIAPMYSLFTYTARQLVANSVSSGQRNGIWPADQHAPERLCLASEAGGHPRWASEVGVLLQFAALRNHRLLFPPEWWLWVGLSELRTSPSISLFKQPGSYYRSVISMRLTRHISYYPSIHEAGITISYHAVIHHDEKALKYKPVCKKSKQRQQKRHG